MKQLPKKVALLLLAGFLFTQTNYYLDSTTDNHIVCSDVDDSDIIRPCIIDGNIDSPIVY